MQREKPKKPCWEISLPTMDLREQRGQEGWCSNQHEQYVNPRQLQRDWVNWIFLSNTIELALTTVGDWFDTGCDWSDVLRGKAASRMIPKVPAGMSRDEQCLPSKVSTLAFSLNSGMESLQLPEVGLLSFHKKMSSALRTAWIVFLVRQNLRSL